MTFFIKDFFTKCDQIRDLVTFTKEIFKIKMENFIFLQWKL